MIRIGRRRLLLASGATLAAQLAHAQVSNRDRVRTIGVLNSDTDPKWPRSQHQSHQVLKKLGWVEGQNLVIERRWSDFKPERLPALAQEMIRKGVEVLYTMEAQAALAAARVTRTISIVFADLPYPVEQGLVDSLAKPGRNITGTTSGIVGAKRLEFLREIAPGAKRIYQIEWKAVTETITGGQLTATLESNAKRLGFDLKSHPIRSAKDDLDSALSDALTWGAHAIFFSGGAQLWHQRQRIGEFGLRHSLPTSFGGSAWVDAGGLFSYGRSPAERLAQLERGIRYIDRILRGERPADMPIDQPRSYELVINLRTAKALGLTVPQSILLRADRIIQ